jgi:hypothetical protein
LSGNIKNVNILHDLFWEYGLPQQDFSFREYKKKFKLYLVCYFKRQSCYRNNPQFLYGKKSLKLPKG